jgi:ribosomal-protein-alanine N-acetyltransferase
MALFETDAIARGATESFLEVADDNEAAIALYAKCGYSESGRRKNYYSPPKGPKLDALILRKILK